MIRPKPTAISLSQTDVREHISNINRKRALRKQAALGIPSSPVTSESAGSLGSPGSPGSPRQPLYALDNIEPLNPEAPSFTPKFTSNQGGGSTLMATTTLPSIGDSYSLTIRPRNSSVPHSGGTAITIGGSIVRSGTPGHAIEQESRIRARIREAEEQRVLNHNSNAVFHIHDEAMETMNPDNGGSGEDSFSNDDFASDEEIASSPPRPAFDYSSDNEGDVYPRATTSFTATVHNESSARLRNSSIDRLRHSPMPRSPLYHSFTAAQSPTAGPAGMASPRLPSAVGERSTLFSRPPRRSMPRQYRAREATYSYEESENPNNVDEHSAVLPSNEIESTQSGHAESYDRFTVADLSDEIAADEGLSPSSTSQRGHSTPAGRVRHSPAQHDWDYSHGDTNNSSRMPSSPSLQLPPPFSATPRQVSDSSSLPVRTSSDDPRNVYPRATQQGNSMLDGANSSMVYSTDRGEINSSGFLRTNPAYLPRSNGTAIVGGEQGPSSIDAQDGGSSHSPGSNDRVSPRESLASRILAAALPVVWGSSRRASSAGEVRPRQLSRTMPAINMHSVVTPPRHSRLAEPELRGGGRSAEAPESPRRSGNAIRTAVVQVRTPMNRYAARRAEAVARTLDRVTPGRFYVYDDRQPAFNQPITAADLPEARHQGAQTAPNRGYRYYLPREGPTGFPESPTTRYFPRRTRPDSPAGLSSPGMEGLYGGTENRADDELYTHAEMLAARERLERTYLDTDLR